MRFLTSALEAQPHLPDQINNPNTTTTNEIFPELTIKAPEQHQTTSDPYS